MTLPFPSLPCVARGLRAGIGLCVIGALLLPAEAAGQAAVGALVGNVRDESGAVERNALLTGPGYVNLDASIVKIIRFGPRRAEIRADFFNALNIPHYDNPNGTFGNANFGPCDGNPGSD